MSKKRRTLTGVGRAPDGAYYVWCRACPKRTWREMTPGERTGGRWESKEDAYAQLTRHQASKAHLRSLSRVADTGPTPEERLLQDIFGADPADDGPCSRCGHHHGRMRCDTAERIRQRGVEPA